jgi:hypothetical protein
VARTCLVEEELLAFVTNGEKHGCFPEPGYMLSRTQSFHDAATIGWARRLFVKK